jgi:DNA end-binding protein Ku
VWSASGASVLYRRERIVMLEPRGKGLVAKTLRYAYEVRRDEEFFEDIGDVKVAPEMLDLATHIIDKKLAGFDPSRFEDRYQNAVLDLIKVEGREGRPAGAEIRTRPVERHQPHRCAQEKRGERKGRRQEAGYRRAPTRRQGGGQIRPPGPRRLDGQTGQGTRLKRAS